MTGDEQIGKQLTGNNAGAQQFAGIVNELVTRSDRDWVVKIEEGGENQESKFLASEKNVVLLLRGIPGVTTGNVLRVRLAVGGVAQDADMQGTLVDE